MADTTKITYTSRENLEYYHGKNKAYIDAQDAALKSNLEGQIDTVASAVDAEATRAKAEEAKNAAAASAAQSKGEEALAHSEALAAKVGTVPDGSTVMGIIENIQESAYDDTEVRNLISGLDTNKADKTQVATDIADAVKAEEDARKAAITELSGTVSTLEQKVNDNKADIEGKMTALTNRVAANETAVGTTLPKAISDEEAARIAADDEIKASVKAISDDYLKNTDKTELEGKIQTNTDAIGVLNGTGEGSVKKTVDDAINKFATDVTNDNVVNSYKELIDWAATHGGEAAEMAAAIEANETAIGELETFIGSLPEGATVSTVIAYIEKLVADEKSRAEGIDGGLDSRLQAVEAKFTGTGEGSVADQIGDAKQEAIDSAVATAAGDATTKANQAETNAKAYTDTEVGKDRTRLDALEADTHTHSNKALLDTYTQTEADLKDAVDKKHEHSNKALLDGITSEKIAAWDAAEANAIAHANDLNTAMTTTVNGVTDRVAALEGKVGDGFEALTTAQIDAMFA